MDYKNIIADVREVDVSELLYADNSEELFDAYASESKTEFTPEYSVNKDIYISMQNAGILKCFGAYKDNILVGFCVTSNSISPHYDAIATNVMSVFVHKSGRSHGTAKMLLKAVEDSAVSIGSATIMMSAPIGGAMNRFAKSIGYSESNVVYVKDIR